MDSASTFRKLLRKVSVLARSHWVSRILFFLVVVAFVELFRSDQVEISKPDLSILKLTIAIISNLLLLGLFSASWAIVLDAVAGVKLTAVPFVLSQPLKLIPGGVGQPIFLAKQYHGLVTGKNLVLSLAGHALFGVVVPGGFCLALYYLTGIFSGRDSPILMAVLAGVMLSPLFVLLICAFRRNTPANQFSVKKFPLQAGVKIVILGILGLFCHGIAFWALSSDLAFEHALLLEVH